MKKKTIKKALSIITKYLSDNNLNKDFKKAKEQIFNEVFSQTPINIYWMDCNGILQGCNEKVLNDLEVENLDDYIGKHSDHNSSQEAWKNSLKVVETKILHKFEEAHTDKSGKKTYYISYKCPILSENGEVKKIFGISFDITEKKEMEIALSNEIKKNKILYNNNLKNLIKTAHEVKNPTSAVAYLLNDIKQNIYQLKEFIFNESSTNLEENLCRKIGENIKSNLNSVNEIAIQCNKILYNLDNIINLEHLYVDGVQINFETRNPCDLIEEIINEIKPKNNNIEFEKNISTILNRNIIFDYYNIKNALLVIFNNAIRFNAIANPLIKISADTENENLFFLKIQDFGRGMSKLHLTNLFQMNSENIINSKYHKSSTALLRSKLLIEASGGKLEIESIINIGTIVTIKIPYKFIQKNENIQTIDSDILMANTNKTKVLLVEDDLEFQKQVRKELEKNDFIVDAVALGIDAIDRVKNSNYHIIILDIELPDISGIEVIQQINPYIENKIPVIAFTSHDSEDDEDYYASQGIMATLSKSSGITTLLKLIKMVLDVKFDD